LTNRYATNVSQFSGPSASLAFSPSESSSRSQVRRSVLSPASEAAVAQSHQTARSADRDTMTWVDMPRESTSGLHLKQLDVASSGHTQHGPMARYAD